MGMVARLSLIDPASKDFRSEGCRSILDIIRFVHECSMREMFSMGAKGSSGGRQARKLASNLPLTFYVLDVGGGLARDAGDNRVIDIEHVLSLPMKAFWKGLSDPAIRWSDAEHFAWGDYDAIMLAGGVAGRDSAALSSYAVFASDYMNLNVRFGYHFVQVDALAGEDAAHNFITFRFSGGGGNPEGRMLRTKFIGAVLTRLGFKVNTTGELVDAQLKHEDKETILSALVSVGRLAGATRLMDMYLSPDSFPDAMAEEFLAGRSDFSSFYQ